MKQTLWLLPLASLPVFMVVGTLAWQVVPVAEKQDGRQELRSIPTEAIFSNFQIGLQEPKVKYSKAELKKRPMDIGPSNLVLVRAGEVEEAVKAGDRVFYNGQSIENALLGKESTEANSFWLVAFLEAASHSPPKWLVQSVEQRENLYRICYSKPKRDSVDQVHHYHFLWVRLGELQPGTYRLELYDLDKREVMIMRCVKIEKK